MESKIPSSGFRLSALFYWIGVAMTLACIGLVLAGNTKWGYRLEHMEYPVSWVLAGVGVLAFLAREVCRPAPPPKRTSENHDPHDYLGAFEI